MPVRAGETLEVIPGRTVLDGTGVTSGTAVLKMRVGTMGVSSLGVG